MEIAAIDIESTGLNKEKDQVLQLAIVLENTGTASERPVEDLPTFEALIWHERLSGHPIALAMNAEIIEALSKISWRGSEKEFPKMIDFRGRKVNVFASLDQACVDAVRFLRRQYGVAETAELSNIVAAGKNAGTFDIPFLSPAMGGQFGRIFCHRVIDVGSVALGSTPAYWKEAKPPGMRDLHDNDPTHDAVADARDVILLLRKIGGYIEN